MQQITISAIESKEFKVKPRGYDQEEVDGFLDDICDEMERQQAQMQKLQQQLTEARAAVARAEQEAQQARSAAAQAPAAVAAPVAAPVTNADDSLREILEMAQRVKSETIAEAQKKAEQITAEAEAQVKTRLGNLAEERDSLTRQVETLKKTVADYRTRFEELLQAQQDALDKVSDL